MSFENISNPQQREQLFKQYLESKNNIKQNFLNERLGNIEMKRETTKLFSPIIESQQKVAQDTQKAISNIPKQLAITPVEQLKQLMPIETPSNLESYGSIAGEYLKKYINKIGCDIYTKDGNIFIGNKEVKIDDNDIIIDNITFKGTPGLWELLTSKEPKNYLPDDKRNYGDILNSTNAMYRNFDSTQNNPRSSTSYKWKNIQSDIWKTRPLTIREVSDEPYELVTRFGLLLASKQAGNTGVNDEMISIANKLKNKLSPEEYKVMMSQAEASVD